MVTIVVQCGTRGEDMRCVWVLVHRHWSQVWTMDTELMGGREGELTGEGLTEFCVRDGQLF